MPRNCCSPKNFFIILCPSSTVLANDVSLVSKILLGYEEALWPKKLEISGQSNFDTRASDFGSFLVI